MTPHERECALAAIAVRIEAAKREGNLKEAAEWMQYRREVLAAPVEKIT